MYNKLEKSGWPVVGRQEGPCGQWAHVGAPHRAGSGAPVGEEVGVLIGLHANVGGDPMDHALDVRGEGGDGRLHRNDACARVATEHY